MPRSPDEPTPTPELERREWNDVQWFSGTVGTALLFLLVAYLWGSGVFGQRGWWAVLTGAVPALLSGMLLMAAVRRLLGWGSPLATRIRLWSWDRTAAKHAARQARLAEARDRKARAAASRLGAKQSQSPKAPSRHSGDC